MPRSRSKSHMVDKPPSPHHGRPHHSRGPSHHSGHSGPHRSHISRLSAQPPSGHRRRGRTRNHRRPRKKVSSPDMFASDSEEAVDSDFSTVPTPKQIRRKHTDFEFYDEGVLKGQTAILKPKPRKKPPTNLHRTGSNHSSPASFASFELLLSTTDEEFDDSAPYDPADHVKKPEVKEFPVQPKLSIPPEMIQPLPNHKKKYRPKDKVNPSVSEPIDEKTKNKEKLKPEAKASPENMVEYFNDEKDHVHRDNVKKYMEQRPSLGIDPRLKLQVIPGYGRHRRVRIPSDADSLASEPAVNEIANAPVDTKIQESEHKVPLTPEVQLPEKEIFKTIEHEQASSTIFHPKKRKSSLPPVPPPPSRLPPGKEHSVASIVPSINKFINQVDNLEPLHPKVDETSFSRHKKSLEPDGNPKKIVYSPRMNLGQYKTIPKGQKDFVRDNALAAIRTPAKIPVPVLVDDHKGHKSAWATSGLCRNFVFSPGFGRVPKYLCERKRELLEEDYQIKWALDTYGIVSCDPRINGMNQIALLNFLTKRDPNLEIGPNGLHLLRKCNR